MFRKILIGLAVCMCAMLVLSAVIAILGIDINYSVVYFVIIVAYLGYSFYKFHKEISHLNNQHMPQQVVLLLKQAHRHENFETEPSISVSGEMRQKLMYPLDKDIAQAIGSTEYPVTENEFNYEIVKSEWIKNALHLTVKVDIDYCDTAKNIDVHYHNVLMSIVCASNRQVGGFEITSVEHN